MVLYVVGHWATSGFPLPIQLVEVLFWLRLVSCLVITKILFFSHFFHRNDTGLYMAYYIILQYSIKYCPSWDLTTLKYCKIWQCLNIIIWYCSIHNYNINKSCCLIGTVDFNGSVGVAQKWGETRYIILCLRYSVKYLIFCIASYHLRLLI